MRRYIALVATLVGALVVPVGAQAQGTLVPNPPSPSICGVMNPNSGIQLHSTTRDTTWHEYSTWYGFDSGPIGAYPARVQSRWHSWKGYLMKASDYPKGRNPGVDNKPWARNLTPDYVWLCQYDRRFWASGWPWFF